MKKIYKCEKMENYLDIYNNVISDLKIKHNFDQIVNDIRENIRKVKDEDYSVKYALEELKYIDEYPEYSSNYGYDLYKKEEDREEAIKIYNRYCNFINELLNILQYNGREYGDECYICRNKFPKELRVYLKFLYKLHKMHRICEHSICFVCRDLHISKNFPVSSLEDYPGKIVIKNGEYFFNYSKLNWFNYNIDDNIFDLAFLSDWSEENEIKWESEIRRQSCY